MTNGVGSQYLQNQSATCPPDKGNSSVTLHRAPNDIHSAILEAARLRLRPILMTTLTTVTGMLPLAIGISEGSEMLRPLAVTIVWGLSFSMLVSLLLVPVLYELTHRKAWKQQLA